MAASRTATQTMSSAITASGRVSFAKIREPLEVPDLLALQTESFDWLLGNERWQARVAEAKAAGRADVPDRSGLEEIFEEISPIEDFSGSMSLSFRDHRFEPKKYSIEECKERDMTYSAPLFVTAEFMNTTTGEIKSQTVFMGDFPLMTERGTFVINGTERVVVSQLVRSPGVYFERTAGQDLRQGRLHRQGHPEPRRLARVRDRQARHGRRPHRPQAQAVGHGPAEGPGLDRGADPRGVRRVRVDRARPWRRTTPPARTTRCWTSTASCARASRRPARPPRRCWTTSTSTPSATTWPRSVATRSTRSWASSPRWPPRVLTDRRHRRDDQVPRGAARR